MKYTFQHFVDISSSASSMNIITVKAGGKYVFERCKHLFGAYKYFKLGRVNIKLLPAATLPVDPLMMGYGTDEVPVQVDPRDQMNPGLVRITNGENILTDLTGVSSDVQHVMYTNTMLDPRWSKFMLQRGFSRSAVPLFWDVGMPNQSQFPNSHISIPEITVGDDTTRPNVTGEVRCDATATGSHSIGANASYKVPSEFTQDYLLQLGHKVKMGWLPTDAYEKFYCKIGDSYTEKQIPMNARIPSVDLINIVLPKAFKTIYHYRLFITETVYFSGIKNVGIFANGVGGECAAIDNFNRVTYPTPEIPYDSLPPTSVPGKNFPYNS